MQTLSQLPPVRPDTLRWAIFLAVLGPSAALAQTGLEAASGPGGTPVIHNGHGVPVIDIVPPNAKGLSHNQFIDYNVATPGLVLNNATAAGQSQLAGALAANPQFQGQAASTILNEVVSRNASLIEGPQEIFGRPADYILANPNGITLNGGSFINTTRAGFVVGTPQFEEQQLRYLDTLTASGTLQVLEHGQGNAGGALELIAPRVDSKGLLMASETLDITVGRNRIDSRSGEVVEHLPSPSSSIDASLFGAMRAGRIRVVSTAEGAGVRVGASQILGAEGVDISSAGGLHVSGSGDRPTELRSERGVLKLTAADDLMLETVDGQAPRIEARAGKKLTLDAKTIEHIKHDSDSWNKKFWFVTRETYNSKTTTTHQQQQGSQLLGTDSVLLQSGDDMRMTAAKVDAGSELTVDSGAGLDILAGIDSKRTEQQVRHRKDLWRGDSDSDQLKETAKGSTLSAGHMSIKASDNLNVQGSSLHSRGDLAIQAKQADIGTTTLQEHGTQRDYRGDLVSGTFFGDRKGNDTEGQVVAGSTITSDGELTVRADDRDVVTSTTESGGGLTVTGGIDRLGSLFEGHHNREVQAERESKVQRSELQASGDLKLRSDALLTEAVHVEAGNTLQVTAERIDNRAVQDTHEHEQSRDDWSGSLGASIEYRDLTRPIERLVLGEEAARFQQASPEDAMAPPSVGADMTVEHLKRLENQRRGIAQVSELSAAKVEVKADTLADHLVGARLQSAKGDVRLDANSVTQETLSGNDYRRDLSLDASNSPVDLGTAIAEIAKSKMAADGENALDLGVLRTSGHSRSEQWASSMQGKKH